MSAASDLSSSSPATTDSTMAANTNSQSPSIALPLHQAVTIRLTKTNYSLWRAQLLPFLRSTKLLGHLDGSSPASSKTLATSTDAGAVTMANPAYERWYDADQQLLSGLLSSMTEEVLRDVTDATTAKEAWDALQRKFASSTRARMVQIRVELATCKKRDLSATDYFNKVRGLANDLANAGAPLRDDEIMAYLFAGLPAEYDPFVTSMTTLPITPTIDDVFAHLVAFEARQLRHQAELQLNLGASANFAGRGRGSGRGRGRGPGRGHGAPSRGRGAPPSRGGGRGNTPRPTCQICEKEGHTALRCWYRMDESYQEEAPSANVASTSSYKIDANWYPDTGATDHITSDLDRLAIRERYNGGDQVQVGNGAGSSNSENLAGRPM
ncbi:hypothetical protein GUJ93_ZPchr0010g7974 [Zizania palustris]|uniref:Retrotransposon Copia-like N-terminal domain-containing protein n=1 Tax=Zizania palustris TaxID=103762 RepID=A0A8J6BG18_ZIZPA|nr:hypothetical protein GUJ93_ZPchr0010g7974 [Zizania palustris]